MSFDRFQNPISLAHNYWHQLIKREDIVIDATCGNGHDTLFLAQCMVEKKNLWAFDCQEAAIEKTRMKLGECLGKEALSVHVHCQCHSSFPDTILAGTVGLIVYNLGYLPGGVKSLTTLSSTTLQSVIAALNLMRPGGAISLTCYPGHAAGSEEELALLEFSRQLPVEEWSVCHHVWLNRNAAPSLLWLQKSLRHSRCIDSAKNKGNQK